MAAMKQQYKLNTLAKALGKKSKDLSNILSEKGIETKTTQKALEPVEFDILMESLTRSNQIRDIGSYLDGVTYIPSKKKEEPAPAEKTAPEASPAKEAPKTEVKPAEGNAEVKAEAKAAEKSAQTAPAEGVKPSVKAEEKPEGKTAAPSSGKAEAPAQSAARPQSAAGQRPVDGRVGNPSAQQPKNSNPRSDLRPQNANPQSANNQRSANPGQNGYASRPQGAAPAGGAGRPGYNSQQGQYGANTRAPMGQNGQRPAYGQGNRPAYGQNNGAPSANGSIVTRPQYGAGQRPAYGQGAGSSFQSGNRSSGNGFGGSSFGGGFGGGARPNQNRGGQGQRRGNNDHGGDKGDYTPSGPRETFKAQPIVRGATTNLNPDGTRKGPRVIDTHGSSVDLSKYDEKLDSFVSDHDSKNLQGGNTKLKKQNNNGQQNGQNGGNSFSSGNRFQKGGKGKQKGAPASFAAPVIKKPTAITLPEEILVGQLASKLMVTAGEVVKKLMMMGMMVTVNQVVDFDTAALLADEFGVTATPEVVVSIEERLFEDAEDTDDQLVDRAPVVCVMGHVDHGKTSILDAIRHTNVTAGEAGGITQAIGAYRVRINGREITFLDTPGHAAFTAMRARGAMATDIAILVVAADDGIMPQTIEAINHAKAAGIDIIVAINKMDKPAANPDTIKQELTKYGLVPEEWGGDTICVPVSALKRTGIDDLLESVLLVADVKELKANPNRRAKGIVIESKLDRGRGPVATMLVQNGTLRNGDIIIAGTSVGRVRSMVDHNGKSLKEAAPSVPVEITGLDEVPSAGDEFQAVEDERMARTLADQRRDKAKEDNFRANARASLNDLFAQISEGVKDLNIIVKADVDGSVEAVKQSLEKLTNEEVRVRVIHAAAGGITEGDVTFAAASSAIIVGFNVRPDKNALDSAERQGVEIRTYRIIYECIEEIQAAMKGMLAPKFRENLLGHAEVRQTIHVPNVGTIAGSYIQDGKVTRQSSIRVVRDGVVIFEDKISSLKRFKDDAREVAAGYECGIGLEKFNDIKVGDILEAFIMEQIQPE